MALSTSALARLRLRCSTRATVRTASQLTRDVSPGVGCAAAGCEAVSADLGEGVLGGNWVGREARARGGDRFAHPGGVGPFWAHRGGKVLAMGPAPILPGGVVAPVPADRELV